MGALGWIGELKRVCMTSGGAFGALGWRREGVGQQMRSKKLFGHLRHGTKGYLCPVHLEPFLECAC